MKTFLLVLFLATIVYPGEESLEKTKRDLINAELQQIRNRITFAPGVQARLSPEQIDSLCLGKTVLKSRPQREFQLDLPFVLRVKGEKYELFSMDGNNHISSRKEDVISEAAINLPTTISLWVVLGLFSLWIIVGTIIPSIAELRKTTGS